MTVTPVDPYQTMTNFQSSPFDVTKADCAKTLARMVMLIQDEIDDPMAEYAVQIQDSIMAALRLCEREPFFFNEKKEITLKIQVGKTWYGAEDHPFIGAMMALESVFLENPAAGQTQLLYKNAESLYKSYGDDGYFSRGEGSGIGSGDGEDKGSEGPEGSMDNGHSSEDGRGEGSGDGEDKGSKGPEGSMDDRHSSEDVRDEGSGDGEDKGSKGSGAFSNLLQGTPIFYTFWQHKLGLFPTPNKVETVRLCYVPFRFDEGGCIQEDNPWLIYAFDLIKARAKYELYKNILKDPEYAAVSFNDFQEQLQILRSQTSRSKGHTTILATGF
ncbi:hypothetical protein X471_00749 [Bartonella bacilliformis str. Heidi Mejia]|nr:hypothetical protein X471_00749 [Bartonella bacilliformis str. Heidi Mejia]KEG19551.1 hypothetical protein H707_00203 [Bartonella bacilliformis Hosp800-02]KEG24825.1 hypothetical protein H708_00203 [Bartonella bacilliformis VAB9028]KEG24898.1 hypothetical protein H706_00212 [Bartonella bacilliformis CAR600-02]